MKELVYLISLLTRDNNEGNIEPERVKNANVAVKQGELRPW